MAAYSDKLAICFLDLDSLILSLLLVVLATSLIKFPFISKTI